MGNNRNLNLISLFQNKAIFLNEKARNTTPTKIVLFDEYRPKTIPSNVNDVEVLFWYLIVDLYCLFHDSGGYLFSDKKTSWPQNDDRKKLVSFYHALNEVRSTFCHNKPETAYLSSLLNNNHLRMLFPDWRKIGASLEKMENLEGKGGKQLFQDYFDIFLGGANICLDIINNDFLTILCNNPNNDTVLFDEWFNPIFKMYFNNVSTYVRAYRSFSNQPQLTNAIRALVKNDLQKKTAKDLKKNLTDCLDPLFNGHGTLQPIDCMYPYSKIIFNLHYSFNSQDRRELTPFNLFYPLLFVRFKIPQNFVSPPPIRTQAVAKSPA